jgi:hypothetical protein
MRQFGRNIRFSMRHRLRASALLYTVAICMLIGMVLGAMVLLAGYAQLENKAQYFKELAQDNLESGKNLVLYGKEVFPGHSEGMLFSSVIDSYKVDVEAWGLWGLMNAEGVHGQARANRSFLFGAIPEGVFDAQLFLEDRDRALSVAGNSELKGKLYLPEAGLKRGYVGREGFTGKHLHEGDVKPSRSQEWKMDGPWSKAIKEEVQAFAQAGAIGNWQAQTGEHVEGDWRKPAMRLLGGNQLFLDQVHIGGKTMVFAQELILGANAKVDNAIFVARSIVMEPGFTGKGQFFAIESLVVDSGVHLQYPSVVALASGNTMDALVLRNTSKVEGLVWSDGSITQTEVHDQSMITIEPRAEVFGHVIVRDNLNLQGQVHGHVLTGKFRHQSSQAVHDNMLYQGRIGLEGRAQHYAMPLLPSKVRNFVEITAL